MRYILSLIFVTLTTFICAQTQRGVVRTIGTPTHHGQPISNVMVKIKGNNQQFLSGTNGTLELPLHNAHVGDKYQLQNVMKKGYELADKNFLKQTFVFTTKTPLEIVMLSSEDMLREKQTIETRVLNIAERNYKKKIETLKQEQEQGRITVEDYRARYQTLQEQFDTYDEIVSAMAEHYARTDYDRLDSLDVLINTHIINGELDQADILVAQKGNLDDRIAAYQRHAATNAAAREMLDKLANELQEQQLAYEKERDDIANDLYNKHTIAISRFDFNTALEMLKLRADLDTTNVQNVWQCAELCHKQKRFTDAEKYYLIAVRKAISIEDSYTSGRILNNIGLMCYTLGDYVKSKLYLLYSSKFRMDLANQDKAYFPELGESMLNLAALYMKIHDYTEAEKELLLLLDYYNELIVNQPGMYERNIANALNNLGLLYDELRDYPKSQTYFLRALEYYNDLYTHDSDEFRESLAMIYLNLGLNYQHLNDLNASKSYYFHALDFYEQLFHQNPDAYRGNLAQVQNNIGALYKSLRDFENSEKYYKLAIELREQLFMQYPDAYRADLAMTQYNIGNLYKDCGKYVQSEIFYKSSLEKFEFLVANGEEVHRWNQTSAQINFGDLYLLLKDFSNAIKYHESGWKNLELLLKHDPKSYRSDAVILLVKLCSSFAAIKDYDNYTKYLCLALENFDSLFKEKPETFSVFKDVFIATNYAMVTMLVSSKKFKDAMMIIDKTLSRSPSETDFYDLKGSVFLILNKNDEALAMWKKVLELNPKFLDAYPEGTVLSNGLKKLGLIE